MKRTEPLPEGLYCPNPSCPQFGQIDDPPLERHAYYGSKRRTIFLCRACGKTFSQRRGTFFFGLQTPREQVLQALAMVTEHGGIRATARATGFDKDTIQRWVDRAGRHTAEVSAYLIVECHLSEAQLDALWTFVKKKTGPSHRRMTPKPSATSSYGAA